MRAMKSKIAIIVLAVLAGVLVIALIYTGQQAAADKAKSTDKIDSIVAAIMALDRAIRHADAQTEYAAAGF